MKNQHEIGYKNSQQTKSSSKNAYSIAPKPRLVDILWEELATKSKLSETVDQPEGLWVTRRRINRQP